MRRRLGLVIVLGALVAATLLLHALADELPVSALSDGPIEVALGAAARLLGLLIAYWLLASAVLYLLSVLVRLPFAARAIGSYTWRPLRRLIDSGVASSLALVVSAPVSASIVPEYVPIPVSDYESTATTVRIVTTTNTTSPIDILYLPIEPAPIPSPVITDERPPVLEFDHVVVMPGDNMWLLAERRLRDMLGRTPGDHEVAPYWLAVIGANKDRIRSGDPDLIFPGEVLVLPGWELG